MARNVIPVRLVIRAVVYKHVGVRSKITLGIIFLPRKKLKGNRNIGGSIVRLSTTIFFNPRKERKNKLQIFKFSRTRLHL